VLTPNIGICLSVTTPTHILRICILLLLLLLWRYSPGWALASIPIRLQTSRSLALPLDSFIPIYLRPVDTSSSHLVFGLPHASALFMC
jgi:hypothetical protein